MRENEDQGGYAPTEIDGLDPEDARAADPDPLTDVDHEPNEDATGEAPASDPFADLGEPVDGDVDDEVQP